MECSHDSFLLFTTVTGREKGLLSSSPTKSSASMVFCIMFRSELTIKHMFVMHLLILILLYELHFQGKYSITRHCVSLRNIRWNEPACRTDQQKQNSLYDVSFRPRFLDTVWVSKECVQGYEGQSHIGMQVKTEFIWIRPDLWKKEKSKQGRVY